MSNSTSVQNYGNNDEIVLFNLDFFFQVLSLHMTVLFILTKMLCLQDRYL